MDSFNIQNYFKRGKTVVLTLRHGEDEGCKHLTLSLSLNLVNYLLLRQWTDKDTNDLLKLMKAFLPEFCRQSKRKKDVWDDISKELQKSGESGLCWTAEDCRKKWSNMIRTFKGIEEQKHDLPHSYKRVKWPFYDSMRELLTLDRADALPEALTVLQLLKGVTPSHHSATTALDRRKTTVFETRDGHRFSTSHRNQHLLHDPNSIHSIVASPSHQLLNTSLHPMHLVHETDVLGVGVTVTDSPGPSLPVDVAPDNNLFLESVPQPPTAPPPSTHLTASFAKPQTGKTKKPSVKLKGGKQMKRTAEESVDDLFQKFMETTQKQNDEVLQKISSFHTNALALMQERNDLLRDIRDTINNSAINDGSLSQPCQGNEDTLTLHMGPAYVSSAQSTVTSVEGANVTAQLNPTLVLSDAATASALSSFQLEDGTVLSGIDTTDKNVLSNLGSFTESVIPEVSMLHPTLVSVVPVPNSHNNPATNIGMGLPMPSNPHQGSLHPKLTRQH